MDIKQITVPISGTDTTFDIKDAKALSDIADMEAYVGYVDENVIGLLADFENNTFTRLGGAVGKSAGADFNVYPMYSGMKRCNLADDGTVNAYYGDAGYVEDGSNGQVMVEIPKFYYRVVPLKLQKNTDYTGAMGYHLLKALYYISSTPKNGFKVHPLFQIGDRVINKAYISAYEGCIYDVSADAYLQEDEQVTDFTAGTGDKLSSIAGVRPCSGLTQQLTRPNVRTICHNRGTGWEMQTIQAVCAIYLLFIVEYGNCNMQNSLAMGVVSVSDVGNTNCASYTGSTASLGNASGRAESTIDHTGTTQTANAKTAMSYRGIENFYSNIWKWVDGINIWGDGTMGGGQPFICTDNQFNDTVNTNNYIGAEFTLTNEANYIKYFGYAEPKYDWLFICSKIGGSNLYPVGDYVYVSASLSGYRSARFGATWRHGYDAGLYFALNIQATSRDRNIGARLAYFPTA